MPWSRLVCGSPDDDITPVALLERLADRIGCERKLDFEVRIRYHATYIALKYASSSLMCGAPEASRPHILQGGHAFAAADAKCLPYINDWLRRRFQSRFRLDVLEVRQGGIQWALRGVAAWRWAHFNAGSR